jgi:hypothetical protein
MSLPSAAEILLEEHKLRKVRIDPWIAAHLSDVWQSMKSVLKKDFTDVGKQERGRSDRAKPASSHSR